MGSSFGFMTNDATASPEMLPIVSSANDRRQTPSLMSIAFACDQAYAMPLATAIRSVIDACASTEHPIQFFVLTDGFSPDAQSKVSSSLAGRADQIHWLHADLSAFQGFATIPYISKMTYARLQIAHVIPDSVSRLLFLDADLLVLGDLTELWNSELDGHVAGAVLDNLDAQLKVNRPGLELVPRVQHYFNAGVLLIDPQRWREERISEKALEYLKQNPTSPFADQDALNVACNGIWKKLDSTWNCQDSGKTDIARMSLAERPAIVHFFTRNKPWNAAIPNVNAGFYDAYRSRTCFARKFSDRCRDKILSTIYGAKQLVKALLSVKK
jgi:lipopolysaccharide biosynthesis glycosyltransferase